MVLKYVTYKLNGGTMKEKKIIIIMLVLTIVLTIIGSTFAYWNWQSTAAQNTNITFTVGSNFSCSADGGGSITNGQKILAPAACTNSNYAIQRTIVTNVTNTGSSPVYLDLWLDIVNLGSGLQDNIYFKYAVTTSSSSCTTGIKKSGTFSGKRNGDRVKILGDDEYASTGTHTYYLYIWLDARAEEQNTQDVPFNFQLTGSCANGNPSESYVYTTSGTSVSIGDIISENHEMSYNPNRTIKKAIPQQLDFKLQTTKILPIYNIISSSIFYDNYQDAITDFGYDIFNRHTIDNNNEIIESYVGFLKNGTPYYLKGGDGGISYNSNKAILDSTFGSSNCSEVNNEYNSTRYSYSCFANDRIVAVDNYGQVEVHDYYNNSYIDECSVSESGASYCIDYSTFEPS